MNTRRFFLQAAAGLGLATIWLRPRVAHAKNLAVPLANLQGLDKVGGSVITKLEDKTLIFVRDAEDSVKVFDPICSHKNCKVAYTHETKTFNCACHKSAYDLTGKVLGGPAPKDLTQFRSKLAGDKVLVKLPD
jgi:Rieske Fe-S protein